MDPDACLAEILGHLETALECGDNKDKDAMLLEYAKAADCFESLNHWLRQGGFLPRAWMPEGRTLIVHNQPDPLDYGPDEVDPFPFLRPEDSVSDDDHATPEVETGD